MSGGISCKCHKTEHTPPMTEEKWRECQSFWRVVNRRCNYSAFNGYQRTYSAYSALRCLRCGSAWRSKALYVSVIKDMLAEERHEWLKASRGEQYVVKGEP